MPAVLCAAVLSMGLLGSPPGSAARPVVAGVPPATEALADAAERAFDEGRFDEAAQQASLAVGALAQGPRGTAIELRTRELQMVWGAALVSLGQTGPAAEHFSAALQGDPVFAPSADRFAPPIRQGLERTRRERARVPANAALEVSGTIGAAIYLDGLPRGKVPATLAGPAGDKGWLWLERDGARSLAYPVTFGWPLAPIEIEGIAEKPLAVAPPVAIAASLAATSAAVAPAAATSAPPGASVAAPHSGTSPVVWIAVAAIGVAAGVIVGVAVASSSSQSGMAVGIQSSPGFP